MEQQSSNCLSVEQQNFVEELWDAHAKRIFLFVYWKLGGRDEDWECAEDYTSDTFLRAMIAISEGNIPPVGSEKQWLYVIARNICIDHFRRNSRYSTETITTLEEDEYLGGRTLKVDPAALAEAERNELLERLEEEVEKLPPGQRKALEMRLKGSSYKEIADQLNSTAVRTLLYKARRTIQLKIMRYVEKGGRN